MPTALRSILTVVRSILIEIVYSPLWWYSIGLGREFGRFFHYLRYANEYSGLSVWAKNLFVPMYGQNDFAGRIISFFVRIFQLVIRLGIYILYAVGAVLILALYVIVPPVILWKLAVSTLNIII